MGVKQPWRAGERLAGGTIGSMGDWQAVVMSVLVALVLGAVGGALSYAMFARLLGQPPSARVMSVLMAAVQVIVGALLLLTTGPRAWPVLLDLGAAVAGYAVGTFVCERRARRPRP